MSENVYARTGDPNLSPTHERNWAALTHVIAGAAMALSAGTLGFIAALVVYLVYKDRGPFVRAHAANALNVQLNSLLWAIIGVVLALVLVGFLILAVIPIVAVVLHAVGAFKAYNGDWWNPPFTIGFFH